MCNPTVGFTTPKRSARAFRTSAYDAVVSAGLDVTPGAGNVVAAFDWEDDVGGACWDVVAVVAGGAVADLEG